MTFTARLLAAPVALALLLLASCEEVRKLPDGAAEATALGWSLLSRAEYDSAEEAFAHATKRAAPNSPELLAARFGLANAYQHRKPTANNAGAEALYKELAAQDKGGETGSWSALALARIHHLDLYAVKKAEGGAAGTGTPLPTTAVLDGIRAEYRGVIENFSGRQAAEEAAIFCGSSFIDEIDEQNVRKGIAFLEDWLKTHPDSLYAGHACGRIAAGFEQLKEYPAMADALIASLEKNVDPQADLSGTYYRIAAAAERAGKTDVAIKYYQTLIEKHPTDFRVFWCQRGIQRMKPKTGAQP